MSPVVVIISACGFPGRYLCRHFSRQGREVVAIDRHPHGWSGDGMFLEWDGKSQGPWSLALEGAEAVIDLTDHPDHHESRTISQAIGSCKTAPQLWLQVGNADFYPSHTPTAQDEWTGKPGTGPRSDRDIAREAAFFSAPAPAATRKVLLRTGHIMAHDPGSLFHQLWKLAAQGIGGTAGEPAQRVSWIHAEDFLRAVEFIIQTPLLSGILNCASPEHPTRRDFMRILRETAGMPLGIPVKNWGAGTPWIKPTRLHDAGFCWRWSQPAHAVANLEQRPQLDGFFRKPTPRCVGARVWLPATTR
ncbi:MAG: hypothetical protein ACQCXQ_06555 [Verrucomicrobiales bacterium]